MEQLQGALRELEAYFSVSVDAALLDEATLLRFKQASELLLVHKPGFLGEVKCYLLRHYLSQLDDLVQSQHISVQKEVSTNETGSSRFRGWNDNAPGSSPQIVFSKKQHQSRA